MSNPTTLPDSFDSQLAALLTELSDVQHDLLHLIGKKRSLLMAADVAGLAELQPREAALIERLKVCQQQRADLLHEADLLGIPADSLSRLASHLPRQQRQQWQGRIRDAGTRSRLLQHQSLTNWVLVQRTLIHLSQMLEIIATGGRLRPTYGKGATAGSSGGLVDQEA